MAERLHARYGAAPWHLVVVTAAIVLAGWVALRLADEATFGRMLLWFVGAAIAHDLVLFPVYASTDRVLRALVRGRVTLLNHLRFPALGTALLFVVYSPGILRLGETTHEAATGQDQRPYLPRWLLLSATLFLLSGVTYLLRRRRQVSAQRSDSA
ncbi:hypothetical protein C7C45_31035 [Micromonospora arborensis]|uniref:Uncharacterized protein n=1 Tax=Micromonospora arborensis TaxID=2116518 RepID=A0A318NAM7_9ACTN|nr:hypothetical protein [Micromonospora arborensis]PYC63860.1 hypothetical protein C7C45_31035 [Micromonospora arborensis]